MADESQAAVYASFATIKNSIENLAQGLPNQVDRSTFPGLSGGVQSQVLSAFKFLGLIADDNKPTASLHALAVPDEGVRKEKLKEILRDRYAELFAIDLSKATLKELNDRIGEAYNVTGDTKEKAIRFFLAAVQYVGIPVSRFLVKVPGGSSGNGGRPTRQRRTLKPKVPPAGGADADVPPPSGKSPGTSRAVTLRSGGTLTLAATLDLFSLSAEDRSFVFELIDKLDAYAKEGMQK